MEDGRREQRGGGAGTVVAAGALCSTDLLRAPEQSSSTDHSRRAPDAAQRENLTQIHTRWRRNCYLARPRDRGADKEEEKKRVIGEEVRRTGAGSLLFLEQNFPGHAALHVLLLESIQ